MQLFSLRIPITWIKEIRARGCSHPQGSSGVLRDALALYFLQNGINPYDAA